MAKIIIGNEHAAEFDSIKKLYNGGFLSDKVNIKRVTDREIVTLENTFVFAEDRYGIGSGTGAESELRFDKNGASWFSGLRGGAFDSSSADWEQLIADVAADYHKYYSLIEFRRTVGEAYGQADAAFKTARRVTELFIERVFGNGCTLSDKYSAESENFYAVSLRLDINGGAESVPVLGKMYFRKDASGGYTPMLKREASAVDGFIATVVPGENSDRLAESNTLIDGDLVGGVLGAAGDVFESGDGAEYLLFDDVYAKKIEDMLDKLATNDEKELECTSVTVLGISHVEWQNLAFPVYKNGAKALKLVIGLNDAVGIYCTNCDAAGVALADNNVVLFGDDERNGRYVIDVNKPDLGFTDGDIGYIRNNALLKDHLFSVSCPDNPRNAYCIRTVCASQAVSYKDGKDGSIRKCKNCPYPEVVYRDVFDYASPNAALTHTLNLDEQAFRLTDKKTSVCKCCGRSFFAARGETLCRLCSETEFTEHGKKLYKKYGKMLSPGVRFKHLFSKKCCREDSNMIVFELANDRYVFDKLGACEYGLIDPPKKVRPS